MLRLGAESLISGLPWRVGMHWRESISRWTADGVSFSLSSLSSMDVTVVMRDRRPDNVSPSSSPSVMSTSRHRLGSSTAGRLDASDVIDDVIPSASHR